jgi:hypothetical protein
MTHPLRPQRAPTLGPIGVSALDSAKHARHRWYFFKEAFSPDIVKLALKDTGCDKGDLVVDPFCGSGTVTLQATLAGQPAVGTEVNPFLAFVARTKLEHCRATTLEARAEAVTRGARRGRTSPLAGFSTFSRRRGHGRWLFNDGVLEAFEGASHANDGQGVGTASHRLLKLASIGAAMDVCNAAKDGKCLRYIPDWRDLAFSAEDFVLAFESRVKVIAEDLASTPVSSADARVVRGDSRATGPPGPFKLCVTSPPYLNSFDYTDVYRPELFLGKWIQDMGALRRLRLRTLRSHVQVEWELPSESDFGPLFAESAHAIRHRASKLWNGRIPLMIQAYFQDMRLVLRRLRARALPDASLWIVVSTSAYAGVEIPVDLILSDIAASCNWHLREVSVLRYLSRVPVQQWSRLSKAKLRGPHLRESLIILDATPRKDARRVRCSKSRVGFAEAAN